MPPRSTSNNKALAAFLILLPLSCEEQGVPRTTKPVPGAGTPAQGGGIAFDPPEVDLGRQVWGTAVPVRLHLWNNGAEAVRLESVSPDCLCTVVDVEQYRGAKLGPGQRLPIDVTVDTEYIAGPKVRTLSATTLGGETCTARMTLDVAATYAIEPETLDFGTLFLEGDDCPDVPHTVARFSSTAARVVDTPVTDSPWLEAWYGESGDSFTDVHVQLLPERLPAGKSRGSVIIRTNDPTRPVSVVSVLVVVTEPLTAFPSQVRLRGATKLSVTFRTSDGQPARLVAAEPGSSGISASIRGAGCIEIGAVSGQSTPEATIVRVTDEFGRQGRVVSVYRPLG